jgi:cytochrome b561
MPYSRFIRWSHALAAITIVFQMAISLIMDHPHAKKPMTPDGGFYFQWHEWVGLAALAVLACGVIYRVINWKRQSQGRLFPWLSATGRQDLYREVPQFLLLRWTKLPIDGALSGTLHGLGLLIAAAMALTGGILYIGLGPQNSVTPGVHNLMDLHSFLATFMWIYLCGHAFMAVWHQYAGHGSFARIFKP